MDEKQRRQSSPNHLQGPRKHWSIVCLKNRSPTSAVKTTVHLMNSGTAAGGGVAGEFFSVARCRRLPEVAEGCRRILYTGNVLGGFMCRAHSASSQGYNRGAKNAKNAKDMFENYSHAHHVKTVK